MIKRKPTQGGLREFAMNDNQESERGIIPAGTRVKLFEGRVTLLEDVVVDANQEWIDKAIKDQQDYFNGVRIVVKPYTPCTPSGKSGSVIDGSKNTEWML